MNKRLSKLQCVFCFPKAFLQHLESQNQHPFIQLIVLNTDISCQEIRKFLWQLKIGTGGKMHQMLSADSIKGERM